MAELDVLDLDYNRPTTSTGQGRQNTPGAKEARRRRINNQLREHHIAKLPNQDSTEWSVATRQEIWDWAATHIPTWTGQVQGTVGQGNAGPSVSAVASSSGIAPHPQASSSNTSGVITGSAPPLPLASGYALPRNAPARRSTRRSRKAKSSPASSGNIDDSTGNDAAVQHQSQGSGYDNDVKMSGTDESGENNDEDYVESTRRPKKKGTTARNVKSKSVVGNSTMGHADYEHGEDDIGILKSDDD